MRALRGTRGRIHTPFSGSSQGGVTPATHIEMDHGLTMKGVIIMTLKHKISRWRKLTALIAAGAAAVALALGGYAIADSSSNNGVSSSAKAATAGHVIPFQRGEPSPAKQVGQVPANWSAGTGTIVTGEAANKAKAAAVDAYPGGTVNRVVLLSNGEYNVHLIGVNWPHHVFVSKTFNVIGAE